MIRSVNLIKKYRYALVMVLLTILAGWLRIYKLDQLPTGFFMDEAALGYNAWSLLLTGRDEWGKLLPLTLRSFDDWKPAIYAYLTIPGIALFGLSEFTSRLPAALSGALLPLGTYLLLNRQQKNKNLSLLAALFICLSPWHIEISRTAIEAGVALNLSVWGLYLFSFSKSKRKQLAAFGLLFLTLFTYHSARLVVPFLTLSYLLINAPYNHLPFVKWKKIALSQKIIALLLILAGLSLALNSSSQRFKQISIFNDRGMAILQNDLIRTAGNPDSPASHWETRLALNKYTIWLHSFSNSYFKNTSYSYLFLEGAQPKRVTIPLTGQFQLVLAPFFTLGLLASIKKLTASNKWQLFWFFWAPLPAALTYAEIPHTYRTVFLIVPVAYLSAQGVITTLDWLKKWIHPRLAKVGLFMMAMIYLFYAWKSWFHYSVNQQFYQPWDRHYGYQELVHNFNTKWSAAEKIIITNRQQEPYIFFLFYNRVLPQKYQQSPQKRLSHQAIEAGATTWKLFDKYTFSEAECPFDREDQNPQHYYVGVQTCVLPPEFELIDYVRFLDGTPQFVVAHPRPPQKSKTAVQ